MHACLLSCSVMSDSLQHNGLYPTRLLSMGFSRQEYWSGLPFSSPKDLPNLGIESWSPALQVDSLPSASPGKPMKLLAQCLANSKYYYRIIFVKVTSWFSLSVSINSKTAVYPVAQVRFSDIRFDYSYIFTSNYHLVLLFSH